VDDDLCNAFIIGEPFEGASAIGLTRGLMERLTPEEHLGVFAHLIARRKVDVAEGDFDLSEQAGDAEALRVLKDPVPLLAALEKMRGADVGIIDLRTTPLAEWFVTPALGVDVHGRTLQPSVWERIRRLREVSGIAGFEVPSIPDEDAG
jgi:Zn-dependent protease with chaperone function